MNGDEASPSVTAGHGDLDGTPSGGDEPRGGVMSALKGGPGVSLGIENAAYAVLVYKVG